MARHFIKQPIEFFTMGTKFIEKPIESFKRKTIDSDSKQTKKKINAQYKCKLKTMVISDLIG